MNSVIPLARMNSVISLARDNQDRLKFNGSLIAESGINLVGWNYIVYKTADSVRSCAYVLYIDCSQTIIMDGKSDAIQFESRDALISYITEELSSDDVLTNLLEQLGVDNAEYLE